MPKQYNPDQRRVFEGVVTIGNPLQRPRNSSVRCQDFRIMPGGWLRLRSGRDKAWPSGSTAGTGVFRKFHELQRAASNGGVFHAAHRQDGTGTWNALDMSGVVYSVTPVETIGGLYGYNESVGAAVCSVRDKMFWYNGYGVRDMISIPPLSSWDGSRLRYVGLDAFAPTAPAATFNTASGVVGISAGAFRKVYVGLMNSATQHFSNGVECGTLKNATGSDQTGKIDLTGLTNLKVAYHDGAERAELFYVFWVSLDGGSVPYLVSNIDGSGPVKVAVSNATASLGASGTFFLDVTQEMPKDNFPPRPMKDMCYANGRIYGIPMAGGYTAGTYRDFDYTIGNKSLACVVWSAAADDSLNTQFVGVPEEAWPMVNRKYTPNGQAPAKISTAPDSDRVIVITRTGTFYLEETADGLHQWYPISWVDGIWGPDTYVDSPYGSIWLTQNKQIVLLRPGAQSLEVLSSNYPDLFGILVGNCPADYIRDPNNQRDCYQIWFGDGTSVIHDFALANSDYPNGQGYTATGWTPSAAKSMIDAFGYRHHIIADANIWIHEGNPFNDSIPHRDQKVDRTYSELPTADYIGQLDDYGDAAVRKQIQRVDIIGDSRATVSLYVDQSSTKRDVTLHKTEQATTDQAYSGQVPNPHMTWAKLRVQLPSHSADGNFAGTISTGELTPNLYGALARVSLTVDTPNPNPNRTT